MIHAVTTPEERFTDMCISLLSLMPKRGLALMYRNANGNAFCLCGDGRLLNRVGKKFYFTECGAEDVAEAVRFFRIEPQLDLNEALQWASLRIRQILEWPERHLTRSVQTLSKLSAAAAR